MSQEATLPPPAGSAAVDFRIDGPLPPRKVPLAYTIALALTALAMVLLPALYVALIVAAGYGLKYYAIHATAIFGLGRGGFWLLLLYLTPLVAGVIMIAFMIKPLFARATSRAESYRVDLDQEPRLRAVIAAICRQVGAPVPVEVRVDCQPNASAALRRGLLSLGQKDLVLTIGLPLAGQLKARQLAGVLAHEFGHFRQGAGMAFYYLIASINHWFARVVFERDSWDEALADHARDPDAHGGTRLVAWTAQGAVWLSRRILFLFMQLGRIITCLQSRQMEYDADYYSAQIAGSTDFNETSRELRRLTMAADTALNELGELWQSRQLFDDFPAYVALRRTQLTYEEIGKIDGAAIKEKAGWFDTHPTEVERGARVRALKLPGLFHGDAPATALFQDFVALSREATLHFYREQLQLSFEPESIVSTASAAQVSEDVTTAEAARLKLLGAVLTPMRPILWAHGDFGPPLTEPIGVISAQLTALEAQIAGLRLEAEPHHAAYHTLREEIGQAKVAQAFHAGEVVVQSGTFTLELCNLPQTERRLSELEARLTARRETLAPLEASFHAWVCLVGRTARTPDLAAHLPAELVQRIVTVTTALMQMRPWFQAAPEWAHEHLILAVLAASEPNFTGDWRFKNLLGAQREKIRSIVVGAPGLLTGAPWPFVAPGAPRTIAEHLERSLNGVHGEGRIVVLIRATAELYLRLLGEVAKLGGELQAAVAPSTPSSPESVEPSHAE